jgi:hypothetical protein
MSPGSAETPNRSRWMRAGRECMAAGDWAGAIRAYGQGLMEQPLLGMHDAANLERARTRYRQERQTINQQGPEHTTVVVAAAELSHNAAGRAYTLAQLYRHLGHPVTLLGSLFPQWGRELREPIRGAVQQQGLPAVVFGLLYKRLCHGLPEPRELMGPLWTRLAVDLPRRFDGITVANRPLQERYGGRVIPQARDPERLQPATAEQKAAARQRSSCSSGWGTRRDWRCWGSVLGLDSSNSWRWQW